MKPTNRLERLAALSTFAFMVATPLAAMTIGGCFGGQARTHALDPVLTPDAKEVATYAKSAPGYDVQAVTAFEAAVTAPDWLAASEAWPKVKADADRGIDAETTTGPAGKQLGHELVNRVHANLARRVKGLTR